jgi:hypothetical protein
VREYFCRLLGGEEMDLGVYHVKGILGNVVTGKLSGKNLIFFRKATNGKVVGRDGYPMEFWHEKITNYMVGKVITKIMNKIYETDKFPAAKKTSLLHIIYKGKEDRENWTTIEVWHYC